MVEDTYYVEIRFSRNWFSADFSIYLLSAQFAWRRNHNMPKMTGSSELFRAGSRLHVYFPIQIQCYFSQGRGSPYDNSLPCTVEVQTRHEYWNLNIEHDFTKVWSHAKMCVVEVLFKLYCTVNVCYKFTASKQVKYLLMVNKTIPLAYLRIFCICWYLLFKI